MLGCWNKAKLFFSYDTTCCLRVLDSTLLSPQINVCLHKCKKASGRTCAAIGKHIDSTHEQIDMNCQRATCTATLLYGHKAAGNKLPTRTVACTGGGEKPIRRSHFITRAREGTTTHKKKGLEQKRIGRMERNQYSNTPLSTPPVPDVIPHHCSGQGEDKWLWCQRTWVPGVDQRNWGGGDDGGTRCTVRC